MRITHDVFSDQGDDPLVQDDETKAELAVVVVHQRRQEQAAPAIRSHAQWSLKTRQRTAPLLHIPAVGDRFVCETFSISVHGIFLQCAVMWRESGGSQQGSVAWIKTEGQ